MDTIFGRPRVSILAVHWTRTRVHWLKKNGFVFFFKDKSHKFIDRDGLTEMESWALKFKE